MAFISIKTTDDGKYLGVDVSSVFVDKENLSNFYNSGNITKDLIDAILFADNDEQMLLSYSSSVDDFVTDNRDKYHFITPKNLGGIDIIVPVEITNEQELINYLKGLKECN